MFQHTTAACVCLYISSCWEMLLNWQGCFVNLESALDLFFWAVGSIDFGPRSCILIPKSCVWQRGILVTDFNSMEKCFQK